MNRLRYYVVVSTKNGKKLTEHQKEVAEKTIEGTSGKHDSRVEKIKLYDN